MDKKKKSKYCNMKKILMWLPIGLILLSACTSGQKAPEAKKNPPSLIMMNRMVLQRSKNAIQRKDPTVMPAFEALTAQADKMLGEGPYSVMDKQQTPPSGDKHDYMSVGPYWWPDPSKPDGLPYIRKDGEWLWANSGVASNPERDFTLISSMDGTMHECILYFPLYSEEYSIQIGVEEDAVIEAVGNPFRHRLAVFGSSFTHGSSTSRSGMAYPAQFSRATGMQMLSLGCSGNCRLQPYFADVMADVEADAYVFDTFSNPDWKTIKKRLIPFIDRLVEAHPGKPLIFQRTICLFSLF